MGHRDILPDDKQTPCQDDVKKLHALRILYFYLAVLLYNVWVMLNYYYYYYYYHRSHEPGRNIIIADSLKVYVVLAAILSFITDIEDGT